MFAIMLVTLTGCYANKPLGPVESGVFDDRLLGRWLYPQGDDGQVVEVVVARFNEMEYVVSPAHDFSETEALRFHVTALNGQRFINAQDLNPDLAARGFMFARYTLAGPDEGVLEVPALDAIPHEVSSSSQLAEHFARQAQSPGFYTSEPIVVRRVKEE